LYQNNLASFLAADYINLGVLAPGNSAQYNLDVYFDINAGNEYQGKGIMFDLAIGSLGDESGSGDDETADDDADNDDDKQYEGVASVVLGSGSVGSSCL